MNIKLLKNLHLHTHLLTISFNYFVLKRVAWYLYIPSLPKKKLLLFLAFCRKINCTFLVFKMYNGKNSIAHKNRVVTNKSLVNVNQHPRRCPKYAIVRLSEGTNVLKFYQLLLDNGHEEVSFVNELRENGLQMQEKSADGTGKTIASTSNETEQKKIVDGEQKHQTDKEQKQSPEMVDKGVQVIPERTIFASPSFSSSFRTQLPASPILRTAKKEQKPSNTSAIPLQDTSNQEKQLSFD